MDPKDAKKMLDAIGKTVLPTEEPETETEDKDFSKMYIEVVTLRKKVKALEDSIEETDQYKKRIWELEQHNNKVSQSHKDCSKTIIDLKSQIKILEKEIDENDKIYQKQEQELTNQIESLKTQIETLVNTLESRVKESTESILKQKDEETTEKQSEIEKKDKTINLLKAELAETQRPYVDFGYENGRKFAVATIVIVAVEIVLRFNLWKLLLH